MNKYAKRRNHKKTIRISYQRMLLAALGMLAIILIALKWYGSSTDLDLSDIRMFEEIPENDTVIARFDVVDETSVLSEMVMHEEKPAAEDHQEKASVPMDVLFDIRNAKST